MTISFGQNPDSRDPAPSPGISTTTHSPRGTGSDAPRGFATDPSPKATILIVEDECIFARDLSRRLTESGYAVAGSATRAEEAIAKANVLRPDLVLMDIRLDGDDDGIEAAKAIHGRWGIPIVFMTAYGEQDLLDRASETLPPGYLIKPVNSTEVKHGFPDDGDGVVHMALRAEGPNIVLLTVCDSGVGLPPAYEPALALSLGHTLVTILAAQINARLSIDRSAGARFDLRFSCQQAIA